MAASASIMILGSVPAAFKSRSRSAPRATRSTSLPPCGCCGKPARVSLSRMTSSTAGAVLFMGASPASVLRSEEHTSELQSRGHLVCRLLLEKKEVDYHANSNAHTDITVIYVTS